MKKFNFISKKIITWLFVNYGIFLLAFLTLGFLGENKGILIFNFVLDVILCIVSLVLNIMLFMPKHKTPLSVKFGLLLSTVGFSLFTYVAFLTPEAGLPPILSA